MPDVCQHSNDISYVREAVDEIKRNLSTLTTTAALQNLEIRGLAERLDKLNGSVAKHESRLVEQELELTRHVLGCAMKSDVAALDTLIKTHLNTTAVRSAVHRTWVDRIFPLLYVVGGAIGALLLLHGREVLGVMR